MTPFYIDFSGYPEAVASVLYEEVQKHAFELGYEWCRTKKTIEPYETKWHVIIFDEWSMSVWIDTPTETNNKVSVEEFLEMKNEPEYHVGTPMINEDSVLLYLKKEGETAECFTGVALKHSWGTLQYISCDYYDAQYWKPIDPSRIRVTIN